jgi:hypothetical protein
VGFQGNSSKNTPHLGKSCNQRAILSLTNLIVQVLTPIVFLDFLGGMRKNRPNTEDLKRVEEFALNLKQNLR